jgi:hypothetical protein
MLTTGTSRTFTHPTSSASPSITSLPASEAGLLPCDSPAGPTQDPSGPVPVPASPSRPRASARERKTVAISGPFSTGSSPSAILSSSLANRLKARTDALGSTLYKLTWKQVALPSGRLLPLLRASGRRMQGTGCTGWQHWPTPRTSDTVNEQWETKRARNARHLAEGRNAKKGVGGMTLPMAAAQMAPWPTPNQVNGDRAGFADDQKLFKRLENGHQQNLQEIVKLAAAWTTPQAHDVTPRGRNQKAKHGTKHGCADLNRDAMMTGWPTPNSMDTVEREQMRPSRAATGRTVGYLSEAVVEYGAIGQTSTGSPAATASSGQLNPALSRWLMGFPPEWDDCAAMVTPSSFRKPKRS